MNNFWSIFKITAQCARSNPQFEPLNQIHMQNHAPGENVSPLASKLLDSEVFERKTDFLSTVWHVMKWWSEVRENTSIVIQADESVQYVMFTSP